MAEDHRDSPAGAPGAGPVRECPWCFHIGPPQFFVQYQSVDKLPVRRKPKTQTSVGSTTNGGKSVPTDGAQENDEVALASVACSLLMKVLWAARLARPDLLRAVTYLATKVSKWTSKCESMMHRFMGYIQATLNLRMIGWIGDSLDLLYLHFFADADFAGDVDTQRSTSGFFSVIRGPNSSFPISAGSKRQSCVSHSAPEAELVAADFGLRTDGLPSLSLWRVLFPHHPPLLFHEDNQAMIRVVTTGKNPTVRYLACTHRVSVAWLHEVCKMQEIQLVYEETSRMCADIFTKAFTNTVSWKHACDLSQIVNPEKLELLSSSPDIKHQLPTPSST